MDCYVALDPGTTWAATGFAELERRLEAHAPRFEIGRRHALEEESDRYRPELLNRL